MSTYLARCEGPLAEFTRELVALRRKAGMTQAELATRMDLEPAAVGKAESVRSLPPRGLMSRYVAACGGDTDEWRDKRDKLAHRQKKGEVLVRLKGELGEQVVAFMTDLTRMKAECKVSYRAIVAASSRSYAHVYRELTSTISLPDLELVQCVVKLCGANEAAWEERLRNLTVALAVSK